MAAGDLSGAQHQYMYALVSGTGIDRHVATAWIGAESGWNTTDPDNNYLNIGPGRSYPDAITGANAAVKLIRESDHYAGIREAIKNGTPEEQIDAIAASPWDEGNYGGDGSNLRRTYEAVAGGTSWVDKSPGEAATDAVKSAAGAISDDVWDNALTVGLALVFTVAAVLMILLGLVNLLGFTARDAIDTAIPG